MTIKEFDPEDTLSHIHRLRAGYLRIHGKPPTEIRLSAVSLQYLLDAALVPWCAGQAEGRSETIAGMEIKIAPDWDRSIIVS